MRWRLPLARPSCAKPCSPLRRPLSAPWAWWEPLLRRADIVVANVGHHYRALDGRYARYGAMVRAALARFDARMPPHAHLVFRTSNIGHLGCDV